MPDTQSARPEFDHDSVDGDIDAAAYIRALWRRRLAIGVGTLVVAATTFAVSSILPPQYRSTAVLIVNQPKIGDTPMVTTNTATFARLLANQTLAAAVIKKFSLDQPPEGMTTDAFLARLEIAEIGGTALIRVGITMGNAQTAADVLNAFAAEAVALNRRLNQGEAIAARDLINSQLEQARARLKAAESALLEYRRKGQIDLVKNDAKAQLDQRSKLIGLLVDIETNKAGLAKAEEQLAKRERFLPAKRAMDIPPIGASSVTSNPVRLKPELTNEYADPVYEGLEWQVSSYRTTLATLERQRRELIDVLKLDAAQLTQLTMQYTIESDLARVQMEYDIAAKTYGDVSAKFEEARLLVAGRTAELQIVDPAVANGRKVSPTPLLNALVAFGVGLVLIACGSLFFDYLRKTLA
jgi:uncharacterized protein involved in exopolysaccharide biosynthesis